MQVPLHPLIVHFPMAITFVLPVLVIIFAFMIKAHKMSPKAWLIIIGLQLAVVVMGYVSLETGETEEQNVEKVVVKEYIHEHEEAAEIFVGSAVIALVMSVAAYFIRKETAFAVKIGVALVCLVSCYLAYQTGKLGGELVYRHGAASVYTHPDEHNSLLPTPGLNTSESSMPADENESLKADENDYGNGDEAATDEDLKQED